MYAGLILLRSTGATDIQTLGEPRLASYVSHYYGLEHPATPAELASLAETWHPFRTWASVLIRSPATATAWPGRLRPGAADSAPRRSDRPRR